MSKNFTKTCKWNRDSSNMWRVGAMWRINVLMLMPSLSNGNTEQSLQNINEYQQMRMNIQRWHSTSPVEVKFTIKRFSFTCTTRLVEVKIRFPDVFGYSVRLSWLSNSTFSIIKQIRRMDDFICETLFVIGRFHLTNVFVNSPDIFMCSHFYMIFIALTSYHTMCLWKQLILYLHKIRICLKSYFAWINSVVICERVCSQTPNFLVAFSLIMCLVLGFMRANILWCHHVMLNCKHPSEIE